MPPLLLALARASLDGLLKPPVTLNDLHPFECSEVLRAARESMPLDGSINPDLAFLPAPRTWIEFEEERGVRIGLYLQERKGWALVSVYYGENGRGGHAPVFDSILSLGKNYETSADFRFIRKAGFRPDDKIAANAIIAGHIYALLAIINTPRAFPRRVCHPHKGLARRISRAQAMTARYQPREWTELVLSNKPLTLGREVSGHTGAMPLHFVRKYWKPSEQRHIESHWRGDAENGIVLRRYRVTA
jgi:hypothetical protein